MVSYQDLLPHDTIRIELWKSPCIIAPGSPHDTLRIELRKAPCIIVPGSPHETSHIELRKAPCVIVPGSPHVFAHPPPHRPSSTASWRAHRGRMRATTPWRTTRATTARPTPRQSRTHPSPCIILFTRGGFIFTRRTFPSPCMSTTRTPPPLVCSQRDNENHPSHNTIGTLRHPFVWGKGVLNGYSRVRASRYGIRVLGSSGYWV